MEHLLDTEKTDLVLGKTSTSWLMEICDKVGLKPDFEHESVQSPLGAEFNCDVVIIYAGQRFVASGVGRSKKCSRHSACLEMLSSLGLTRDNIMNITKSKRNLPPIFMSYLNNGATNSDSSSDCPIASSSEIVNTGTSSNSGIKVSPDGKALTTLPASASRGQIYDLGPMDPKANYVGKLEELCVLNFDNSPMYQAIIHPLTIVEDNHHTTEFIDGIKEELLRCTGFNVPVRYNMTYQNIDREYVGYLNLIFPKKVITAHGCGETAEFARNDSLNRALRILELEQE